MVQLAKQLETIADIDERTTLDREPVVEAHGVDEGDGTEHDDKSQLQQTKFYCEDSCQCNTNANGGIPSAHGAPLEGEWELAVLPATFAGPESK